MPKPVQTGEVLGSGKVVLFAVPGAFTPGCSKVHLPGFVQGADEVLAKGVDRIVCIAVNDAWVMDAWGKSRATRSSARGWHRRLHQGDGLEFDGGGVGLGSVARYAAVSRT